MHLNSHIRIFLLLAHESDHIYATHLKSIFRPVPQSRSELCQVNPITRSKHILFLFLDRRLVYHTCYITATFPATARRDPERNQGTCADGA
jgi:hypothetical protein